MPSSAGKLIIAIDGPSGAGKGTIARAVAARLQYRHIDTGAMYRAVAWKALQDGLDVQDEAAVASVSDRAEFDLDAGRVVIDGLDVSSAIRTPSTGERLRWPGTPGFGVRWSRDSRPWDATAAW